MPARDKWWVGCPTVKKLTFGQLPADIPEADLAPDIMFQFPARVMANQLCDVTHDEFIVAGHTQYYSP